MDYGACKEHVAWDKRITFTEWKDSNKVIVASNCCGVESTEIANGWLIIKHEYI